MSYADIARRMPPVPMLPGETLGQYRELDSAEHDRRTAEAWAARQAAPFPLSWIRTLLDKWRGRRAAAAALDDLQASEDAGRTANLEHLAHCRNIDAAHRAGVRADAGDGDIVQEARESARDMVRRLQHVRGLLLAGTRERMRPALVELTAIAWGLLPPAQVQPIVAVSPWSVDWPGRVELLAQWCEATWWLSQRGIDFQARGSIAAALRRVVCERWWRRILRRVHARAVEATARAIGLVSKRAGCYCSDESLRRRAGQLARNAASLESVIAVNDAGQDYTLAELAARGPSNREIRRHELMTRIAGFEVVARDCGHEALFVTVTCPSRMHAQRTCRNGHDVEDNPHYDKTTQPDDAQQYLVKQWARFRSACERWGVELYGFRIAEPNHDATPHWHALLFMPREVGRGTVRANPRAGRPCAIRVAVRLLRRYFWRAAGTAKDRTEQGARRHRVKVERIDWARGSAAGYIAKYVAKNIDGYRVEKDLYGNDALTSSRRVDTWASTWGIRQFQQVGGAPVTVWRELRRLHPDQAAASPLVGLALDAANVASEAEAIDECHDIARTETAAHGWASYLELQGGHRVPRKAQRIKLLREATGELGRYGEPVPPRPVGVVAHQVVQEELPPVGIVLRPMRRTVHTVAEVESERALWMIVQRDAVPAVRETMQGTLVNGVSYPGSPPGQARHAQGQGGAAALPPWSPVNNCTRPGAHPVPLFAPLVRRTRKVGRWHTWRAKPGGEPDPQPNNAAPAW
jgi:hypothetical protein